MLRSSFFRFFFVLLFVFPLLKVGSICAFKVVPQTTDFYVNDAAGLLSPETKKYIIKTNITLNKASGAQVVVVTVPDMGGTDLEKYATTLFRQYGIGDKQKNNGVLFLLALKERKSRIEVGYGLEGVLNDSKTGRIQDEYMIPYFKNGEWDSGIINGFNAVITEIKKEYNLDFESNIAVSAIDDTWWENDFFLVALISLSVIIGAVVGKKIDEKNIMMGCCGIFVYFIVAFILFALVMDMLLALGHAFVCSLFMFIGMAGNSKISPSKSFRSGRSSYSGGRSSSRSFGGGGRSGGGGSSRGF